MQFNTGKESECKYSEMFVCLFIGLLTNDKQEVICLNNDNLNKGV